MYYTSLATGVTGPIYDPTTDAWGYVAGIQSQAYHRGWRLQGLGDTGPVYDKNKSGI